MPRLSIIVPVYNVELYISNCIESIIKQTFSDFELILIDDGSTDKSGVICDAYKEKDSRIIVIHKKNSGVSAARNAGMDIAKGEYITFVDADDFVKPGMYEKMICMADKKNVDITVCGVEHYDSRKNFLFSELLDEGEYKGKDLLKTIYSLPNPLGGCIWNKIVKREKINSVRYREGVSMAEDRLFLFDYFCLCNDAYKMSDSLYCVTEREDSATHSAGVLKKCEMLDSSRLLLKLALKYKDDLGKVATEKYLDDCARYLQEIKEIGRRTREPYKMRWFYLQWTMIKTNIIAYLTRRLTQKKMHRFLFEWIKVWKY